MDPGKNKEKKEDKDKEAENKKIEEIESHILKRYDLVNKQGKNKKIK